MISPKTFEPLVWVYNLGSWLNVFPYYWNKKEGCLFLTKRNPRMIKKYILWKVFAIWNIYIRICIIIENLLIMKFGPNIQPEEFILLTLMASVMFMSIPVHMVNFWFDSEIVLQMNTLLEINKNYGKLLFHHKI